MFLEAEDILTLLIFLTWEVVRTPWDFANPLFREFFTSAETIAAIAGLSTFEFQHDLFDVLNAGSPPSLEWFKTIPDIPPTAGTPICGIYFLILEKDGETPLLYVGSGHPRQGGFETVFSNTATKRICQVLSQRPTITGSTRHTSACPSAVPCRRQNTSRTFVSFSPLSKLYLPGYSRPFVDLTKATASRILLPRTDQHLLGRGLPLTTPYLMLYGELPTSTSPGGKSTPSFPAP